MPLSPHRPQPGRRRKKQAIALVFAETLKDQRKNVRVLALAQTLGAINKAGLADAYRSMYAYHRETGLFRADVLEQIAKATGTRYMA